MIGCNRRELLALGLVAMAGTAASAQNTRVQQPPETPLNRDEWLRLAMRSKSIDSPLYMGRFSDPVYFLLEPISWTPNDTQRGETARVVVPKGFVTDLASIPPVFYSWLRPDGRYAYAAIVHDFLYWEQDRTRQQADDILRAAMQDLKVDRVRIGAIHTAVTNFGESAWNENKARKVRGEKRIILKYPPTADISWEDWKTRSDVFSQ